MKEYSVYFKGRPVDLDILISNLKFRDMVSLQHGIILKDYVSGVHERLSVSAPSCKIGVLSAVGNGKKKSAVVIVNPFAILTNAKDTKRGMASAHTTFLSLRCVGGAVSVAYAGQHEENSVGLNSGIGGLSEVVQERITEKIGIMGGRYRLLNEHDNSVLDEMDSEILHDLDCFNALILHEINHEAADNPVIFICDGTIAGRIYIECEASAAQMQDDAANPHMVLYRTLLDMDLSNLNDIDTMALDQLDYIEVV